MLPLLMLSRLVYGNKTTTVNAVNKYVIHLSDCYCRGHWFHTYPGPVASKLEQIANLLFARSNPINATFTYFILITNPLWNTCECLQDAQLQCACALDATCIIANSLTL